MARTEVTWDPALYQRFGDLRLRPALELLAGVRAQAPAQVIELGCGTGDLSRRMAARWPAAEVVGSDLSPEMLDRARAGGAAAGLRFEVLDVGTWRPQPLHDVIFANAVLHWIPEHEELFQCLLAGLAPGGELAVQMPLSFDLPSHRLMREVLDEGPLGSPLLRERMARRPVLSAEDYYDLLAPRVEQLELWETTYVQRLEGQDPVLDWVSGTGARPVLEGLDPPERAVFLERYRDALRRAYPPQPDGKTLFRFPRLFLIARAAT